MTHPNPTPVTIVRPKATAPFVIGRVVGGVVAAFILALVGWLLGPLVWADYPLSYWQTFAGIFFLRAVLPHGSGYTNWSSSFSELKGKQ